METDLTALLNGATGLTARFGSRMHWQVQPDSGVGFPYVNLTTVSQNYANELDPAPRARTARVQFDVWDETALGAMQARDAVVAFLKTKPVQGVIQGVRPVSARPLRGKSKPAVFGWAIDVAVRGEWA